MNERNDSRKRDTEAPDSSRERGHEQRDVSFRGLMLGIASLAVLLLGVGAAMELLFDAFSEREVRDAPPPSPLGTPASPSEPRLETEPGALLDRLRSTEDALLNNYAWLDPAAGIVRIPIDRAIDVIAERGLPAAGAPEDDE